MGIWETHFLSNHSAVAVRNPQLPCPEPWEFMRRKAVGVSFEE